MSYHHFRRRCEDAMELVLTERLEAGLPLTIHKGMSGEDLTVPRLEVFMDTATPEVFGDDGMIGGYVNGNMIGVLRLRLVDSLSDSTRETWTEYSGAVEDVLLSSDLVTRLNAVARDPLTVFTVRPGPCAESHDDDNALRICEYEITIYGAPSKLEA